jgi:hypothetical protein
LSRKTKIVTVPAFEQASNRDLGKMFLLTEWPAAIAEKWGMKLLFAFSRSNGQIPIEARGMGMEGIAILGLNAFLRGDVRGEEVIPLLDELLDCVKMIRDHKHPDIATAIVSDDDIAEVSTRLWLRSEVIRLHTNFSPADALLALFRKIQSLEPSPTG